MASELKHTVAPAGSSPTPDFNTLADAFAHIVSTHPNLVSLDVYATIEIYGTWVSPDTSLVSITGITTDATRYLHIYTTGNARHAGKWDTSKYYLYVANSDALRIYEDYVRIDGLQIGVSSVDGDNEHCIRVANQTASLNDVRISNCIGKHCNSSSYYGHGLYLDDVNTNLTVWNSIFFNIGSGNNNKGVSVTNAATFRMYNSTVHGGFKYGIFTSGAATLKNCYVGGATTACYYYNSGSLAKIYCASSDSTATATEPGVTATSCINNIAADTDTFVSVTGGSEDYHLAADGASPLQGAGDAPGGSPPLDYTTDIDGETCVDWCIGADHKAPGIAASSISSAEGHSNTSMMRGTIQSEA